MANQQQNVKDNVDKIVGNLQLVTKSNERTINECEEVVIQPKKLQGSDYLLKPELFALVEDSSLIFKNLTSGTYYEVELPDAYSISMNTDNPILIFYSDSQGNKYWFTYLNGNIQSCTQNIASDEILKTTGKIESLKDLTNLSNDLAHAWFFIK